mmetsp:Transcript_176/g.453  ORF Transcript_176/g.453 Transcript_176/m.453 type:complete len:471 (+) Transcript_176:81-1493(+)
MGSNQSAVAASQKHDRQTLLKKKSSVFLRGCETNDEHKLRKKLMIDILHDLKGEEGLNACGLEYRLVKFTEDGKLLEDSGKEAETAPILQPISTTSSNTCNRRDRDYEEEKKVENASSNNCRRNVATKSNEEEKNHACKYITMARLFDRKSNVMITSTNRKEFIADGAMYDVVCRHAMEYSQEVMIRDGKLEWVTIAEGIVAENYQPSIESPIKALVSTRLVEDESRLDKEPTLLIVTGKGRVRAGVFSRQHLLTSGLECSSAVEFVREAVKRKLNVIVLDPNARGDRFAMETFDQSMAVVFGRWEKQEKPEVSTLMESPPTMRQRPRNLYVLSHSQSGAQFERHLLNKAECYLPHIGAITFTDSTHNIQWTKRNNDEALKILLESEKSIYFRRSENTTDFILKPFSSIGEVIDTDEFWKHRFGKIKTLCAGTSEHSLTNWFARLHIWEHFDHHREAYKMASKEGGFTTQ